MAAVAPGEASTPRYCRRQRRADDESAARQWRGAFTGRDAALGSPVERPGLVRQVSDERVLANRARAYVPHPGDSLRAWQVYGALLILLTITLLVVERRRRPYLLVGWLWFLGTLVPMIGLVQVGRQAMADRYAYLPLIGIFIMVCWGVAEWAAQKRLPSALAAGSEYRRGAGAQHRSPTADRLLVR
jgi:hypothetical protein